MHNDQSAVFTQTHRAQLEHIKLLVLDVDGTLTDGGIFLGMNGEEFKRFDAHDGHGMVMLQKEFGVEVMWLSGRSCLPVEKRARELGILTCLQGHYKKDEVLLEEIARRGLNISQVASMGDDLADLAMMKHSALGFAPANAIEAVKSAADYVTSRMGGFGAVREVCDMIAAAKSGL